MPTMEEAARATPFTAHEAAETISRLEGYEDTLNRRAGALTWMFFGLAAAGIFATYTAAVPYLNGLRMQWLLSLLWAPWIGAAAVATNKLWGLLAVAAPERPETRSRIWPLTLVGVALFYVLMGVIFGVSNRLGIFLGPAGWAIAIGTFTIVFAVYQSIRFSAPALRIPFIVGGTGLIALGIVLGLAALDLTAQGLLIALGTLLAYFGAGTVVYRRG